MVIKEKTADLTQKQKIAEATSDKIFKMAGERKEYMSNIASQQAVAAEVKQTLAAFKAKTDAQIIASDENLAYAIEQKYASLHMWDSVIGSVSGKTMQELRANYERQAKEAIADAQKSAARDKGKTATIDATLARYGITDAENAAAVEMVRQKYSAAGRMYKEQIDAIKQNRAQYIKEAAAQIAAEAKPGVSVSDAVAQNTRDVAGNLYSMDVVKKRTAAEQAKANGALGKSIVLVIRKSAAREIMRRLG
jgi:vacuolar-type H+-ATPase subunit F/Vma7